MHVCALARFLGLPAGEVGGGERAGHQRAPHSALAPSPRLRGGDRAARGPNACFGAPRGGMGRAEGRGMAPSGRAGEARLRRHHGGVARRRVRRGFPEPRLLRPFESPRGTVEPWRDAQSRAAQVRGGGQGVRSAPGGGVRCWSSCRRSIGGWPTVAARSAERGSSGMPLRKCRRSTRAMLVRHQCSAVSRVAVALQHRCNLSTVSDQVRDSTGAVPMQCQRSSRIVSVPACYRRGTRIAPAEYGCSVGKMPHWHFIGADTALILH